MTFKISNITISNKNEPLVVAEIGINHNGSLERAINIADQAIKSGAKVIKHQTHIVDDEYSIMQKILNQETQIKISIKSLKIVL